VFWSTPCGSLYNNWTGRKDLLDVPLKPLEISRLEAILIPDMEMGNGSPCLVGTNDLIGHIHLPWKFFFLFFSRVRSNTNHQFVHRSFPLHFIQLEVLKKFDLIFQSVCIPTWRNSILFRDDFQFEKNESKNEGFVKPSV
jgi:hypothetical protein